MKLLEKLKKRVTDVKEMTGVSMRRDPKVIEVMAEDRSWAMRSEAARSVYAPEKVLEKLSHDENIKVRYFVAANESTPFPVLKRMKQEGGRIAKIVISNPTYQKKAKQSKEKNKAKKKA